MPFFVAISLHLVVLLAFGASKCFFLLEQVRASDVLPIQPK